MFRLAFWGKLVKKVIADKLADSVLNQLDFNSRRYQNSPNGGGYAPGGQNSCGTGNMCCDLWLADTLCECMGGDLCSCM